jgi:hypothetical protein
MTKLSKFRANELLETSKLLATKGGIDNNNNNNPNNALTTSISGSNETDKRGKPSFS